MDHYSLQPARIADAARLAAMSQEFVESGLRPAWSAARITWHVRHPDSVVLTAKAAGGVAGFGIMRYADNVAHLNLLAVEPAHRRRGVARRLMNWLEETALTAGTFTLKGLSPLFTGATPPVTMINVETLSGMQVIDGSGSGSGLPAVGSTVSVKGLLFNTPGTPTLVTRTMRQQHGD